ncbi:MAG: DUF4249 domain-containing protein [Bacteroidota bacterium]
MVKCFFKLLLIAVFFSGCQEVYQPPAVTNDISLLVVDGVLNNSNSDTTIIRLSRTQRIQDGVDRVGEANAQMTVEDADGNTAYVFQEKDKGNYFVVGLKLDESKKYRLRIHTANSKEYLSDDIPVIATPPIDSVSWKRNDNGLMFYVSTHDPDNNTKYYRWDYTETWDFHSNYYSDVKYEHDSIKQRAANEFVYECWTSRNATGILLGTSDKLSQDVISLAPLLFIPTNSIELSVKYSVLVRQYALTKQSFDYYTNIKKITEQLGSIFDAQPSQLTGNIHCVNKPSEQVVGFITACSLVTKRIFVTNAQVIPWNYRFYCEPIRTVPSDSFGFYFANGIRTPVEAIYAMPGREIVAAESADTPCVDCTERGGSTTRPDFWQ